MGLALHTWISTCMLMNIKPVETLDSEVELPLMHSAIGGYAEKNTYDAEQLVAAIKDDQTELLPARMADEFKSANRLRSERQKRGKERRQPWTCLRRTAGVW